MRRDSTHTIGMSPLSNYLNRDFDPIYPRKPPLVLGQLKTVGLDKNLLDFTQGMLQKSKLSNYSDKKTPRRNVPVGFPKKTTLKAKKNSTIGIEGVRNIKQK